MASVTALSVAPVPVFTTESRTDRAVDTALPIDKTVDISPEGKKLPEELVKSQTTQGKSSKPIVAKEDPMDLARPDVRPVIEKLDGTKDIAETLKTEDPDPAEKQMQASEAYQTLRQADDAPTTVGTV